MGPPGSTSRRRRSPISQTSAASRSPVGHWRSPPPAATTCSWSVAGAGKTLLARACRAFSRADGGESLTATMAHSAAGVALRPGQTGPLRLAVPRTPPHHVDDRARRWRSPTRAGRDQPHPPRRALSGRARGVLAGNSRRAPRTARGGCDPGLAGAAASRAAGPFPTSSQPQTRVPAKRGATPAGASRRHRRACTPSAGCPAPCSTAGPPRRRRAAVGRRDARRAPAASRAGVGVVGCTSPAQPLALAHGWPAQRRSSSTASCSTSLAPPTPPPPLRPCRREMEPASVTGWGYHRVRHRRPHHRRPRRHCRRRLG